MAGTSKKRADSSSPWELKGTRRKGKARAPGSSRQRSDGSRSEASEWLLAPARKGGQRAHNGRAAATGASERRTDSSGSRRISKLAAAGASQREKRLLSKLRRTEDTVRTQEAEIKRLRNRLAEAEDGIGARPVARAAGGKVTLNQATFEELRELGLSTTQSARLIAHRDLAGGYSTWSQVSTVPGLSRDLVEKLKARARLRTR